MCHSPNDSILLSLDNENFRWFPFFCSYRVKQITKTDTGTRWSKLLQEKFSARKKPKKILGPNLGPDKAWDYLIPENKYLLLGSNLAENKVYWVWNQRNVDLSSSTVSYWMHDLVSTINFFWSQHLYPSNMDNSINLTAVNDRDHDYKLPILGLVHGRWSVSSKGKKY